MSSIPPEEILDRVRLVAAAVFGCSPERVNVSTTAADVDGWDSLSHTLFLAELEREFSIRFVISRIVRLGNVGALVDEIARLLE